MGLLKVIVIRHIWITQRWTIAYNDIKVRHTFDILSKYVCISKDSIHVDLSMTDCLLKYIYFLFYFILFFYFIILIVWYMSV